MKLSLTFHECRVMDHSGLEAVQALVEKYQSAGKSLALVNLSEKCQKMLSGVAATANVACPTEDVSGDGTTGDVKMIKILATEAVNGSSK